MGLHRGSRTELAPYLSCGLVRPGTIVAHGVFLDGRDLRTLAEGNVSIAHCPRANLLAGGRQMDLNQAIDNGVTVGLGTDLGAGKGLSMFRTMENALKVTPDLSIRAVFEMATLAGAAALGLADRIGSLEVGKEADFIVTQPKRKQVRSTTQEDVMDDLLSSLVFCGDDRDIRQTAVCGRVVWPRQC